MRSFLYFFTLALTAMFLAEVSVAQEVRVTEKKSSTGAVELIIFQNTRSGVRQTYDVRKSNNYNSLNFPRTENVEGVTSSYDLSGADGAVIFEQYFTKSDVKERSSKIKLVSAISRSDVFVGTDFSIVRHSLNFYDSLRQLVASKSKLDIVNNDAKVVSGLTEFDQPIFEPVVTSDGKYVALLQGDIVPEPIFSIVEPITLRIFDVANGNEIFHIASSENYSIYPPSTDQRIIINVLKLDTGSYRYIVVDPDNRKIYEREFTVGEVGKLKAIRQEGFVMRSDGNDIFLAFSSQFSQRSF